MVPGDIFFFKLSFFGRILFEEARCQCWLAYYDQRIEGDQMTRLRSNDELHDITAWSCNLGQIKNYNDGSLYDRCWFTNFGRVYLQDIT